MKIIHCADLHLDSPMRFLSPDKARERRAELLNTFSRMIDFAEAEGVSAVIIAGDLFDTKNVSASAKKLVQGAVAGHPGINFYYLRGNHDAGGFLSDWDGPPPNLRLFGDGWTSYDEGGAVITGAEMSGGQQRLFDSLALDPGRVNIVALHGQVVEAAPKTPEDIDLRRLRDRGIDYLALGHVHSYREDRLDGRGRWCYPGCLEGRGFDECGDRGFVLLNIENGLIKSDFIPFARRRAEVLTVDVTGLGSPSEIEAEVRRAAVGVSGDSLVKLVLTGETDVECENDLAQLEKDLEGSFYFVKAADETRLKIDYGRFERDASLKGEFVRTVKAREDLSAEDKAAVIRCGIRALAGEEVGL